MIAVGFDEREVATRDVPQGVLTVREIGEATNGPPTARCRGENEGNFGIGVKLPENVLNVDRREIEVNDGNDASPLESRSTRTHVHLPNGSRLSCGALKKE